MMKRLNALENGCEEGTEGDVEEERRVMALTELKCGQHFCCVTMQLYFFFLSLPCSCKWPGAQ